MMAKGAWTGILKDDQDFSALSIKEGQVITLMGTADAIVAVPTQKITFVEDMTETEKAVKGASEPAGLINLGVNLFSCWSFSRQHLLYECNVTVFSSDA